MTEAQADRILDEVLDRFDPATGPTCTATAGIVDRDGRDLGLTLTCERSPLHEGEHRATLAWEGERPDADLADPDEDFDVELDALPHEEAVRRRLEVVTPNPLRAPGEAR